MHGFRPILKSAAVMALGFAALSAPPAASRSITDTWALLGFARDEACELTIRGNGKTMQIAATGLLPGERARFRLTNTAMKPVDWRVLANRDGSWSQYYVPFVWHQEGGVVAVSLEGSTCSIASSAPWRREVRVIR
jgi:hypothetical protein